MFPETLKLNFQNIPIFLPFLTILFCDYGFGKIFHGVGLQMTNNGTGVYYKPGKSINTDSQIMADFGFHLDNTIKSSNYFGFNNQSRSVFLEIATGYRRELFNEQIAGVFRPVIIIQGGGAVELYTLSWGNIPGHWILKYGSGVGFQFYNGRLLNEIMLKLNQYFSKDINMAFQLAIYLK